jgi:hypothetical protein
MEMMSTHQQIPAAADVVVSLEQRLVAVALKDGQDIPDAELRKALTNAGYTVTSIQRTARRPWSVGAHMAERT